MNPDKRTQIEEHEASCPKCRHAKRIGTLCPIGRKWLDTELHSLIRSGFRDTQQIVSGGVK